MLGLAWLSSRTAEFGACCWFLLNSELLERGQRLRVALHRPALAEALVDQRAKALDLRGLARAREGVHAGPAAHRLHQRHCGQLKHGAK